MVTATIESRQGSEATVKFYRDGVHCDTCIFHAPDMDAKIEERRAFLETVVIDEQ